MSHNRNENTIIAPWVGPLSCKNMLTIVVLSSNREIIEKIYEALTQVHAKGNFRWKLIVLQSFSLDEVMRYSVLTGRISLDFVIIAMDTSETICIEWAKKVIAQVHPDLRRRRVVLVNASGLPVNGMAVNPDELINFETEMRLDMLTANVYIDDDTLFLARRLLKYVEVSVGILTGIPNINV